MRGLGIINAAPVQRTACRRLSVKAAAHVFSPRHGRFRKGTIESTVPTTIAILVGFGAVTPFIAAAILNPPAPSIADDRGSKITASIAAAHLPEKGGTIVQEVAIAPAKLLPTMQSDAMRSAQLRQPLLGAHRQSNPDRLTWGVGALPMAELDYVTEVFRTELQNAEPASDSQADAQPQPEQTELAAADLQPAVKPEPKPTRLAVKEPSPPTRSAWVRRDVRMRAGPRNSAGVVTVVRGGSEVKVIKCRYWCEVAFNGKRGWIYKRFIRGAGS